MIIFKGALLAGLVIFASASASIDEQLITSQEIQLSRGDHLEGWLSDFAAAQKIAEEKKKPILMAFLGPNWCAFSDQLESEILSSKEFLKNLGETFVLLEVDIPQNFDLQTQDNLTSIELKEKYHVDECPSIVLVEPTGHLIGKLNYLPLESKDFANYIKEMVSDFTRVSTLVKTHTLNTLKVDELKSLYVKAGRFADAALKKAILEKGIKEDQGPYFLLEEYGRLIGEHSLKSRDVRRLRNKIFARDPNNKEGSLRKLAIMDFEVLAHSVKNLKNSADAVKPLINYLEKFGSQDGENAWRLEMKISQYLFGKDQAEEALKHAKASYAMAPEDSKTEITRSIDYLQTCLQRK